MQPEGEASPERPSTDAIDGFASELEYWSRELALEGDYPQAIRERTDPALMAQAFPAADVLPRIEELTARLGRRPRVLDVGSGPLSMLAHGPQAGIFELTAADPLAGRYRELLAKHGYELAYPLVECFGERLTEAFGRAAFDLVWIHNALDHSQRPHDVLRECVAVLRPGGCLMFQGWSREGTAEGWCGLHRHDIYLLPGGRLMCETRNPRRGVPGAVDRLLRRGGSAETRCISDGLNLELVAASAPTSAVKKWLEVVWRKPED